MPVYVFQQASQAYPMAVLVADSRGYVIRAFVAQDRLGAFLGLNGALLAEWTLVPHTYQVIGPTERPWESFT